MNNKIVLRAGVGAALALACLAAAANDPRGEWEAPEVWKEGEHELPALPQEEALLELDLDRASAVRYFVDPASVTLGEDGATRATVVMAPRTGARITTFEGFRCETHEYRLYAIAEAGGWSAARRSEWRFVPRTRRRSAREVLLDEVFCETGIAVSADRAVAKLRKTASRWYWGDR